MAYLHERIQEGLVVVLHISKNGMIADIGTKVLSPGDFHRLRSYLVWDERPGP